MITFLLTNLKGVGIGIWSAFTLYILGRNAKIVKENSELNSTINNQTKTITIKKEIINVIQKTKPTDIAGNTKRMHDKKL